MQEQKSLQKQLMLQQCHNNQHAVLLPQDSKTLSLICSAERPRKAENHLHVNLCIFPLFNQAHGKFKVLRVTV